MRQYETIVPIYGEFFQRAGRETIVAQLREAGASRVFLAQGAYLMVEEDKRRMLDILRDNINYLQAEGFEVGVWLWSFMEAQPSTFTKIVDSNGDTLESYCCPADPAFVAYATEYLASIAALHPSMILFDDDYRFGHLSGGMACLCEHHMADIQARLGEPVSREELVKKAFTGEGNRYRDAYMASMGDSLRGFAAAVRARVDQVDPDVRVGVCSCITSWDTDGIKMTEIAEILAGNTKPYLRNIGAPYWAAQRAWHHNLATVLEVERLEASWRGDYVGEMVSEGDTFPRPRHVCPAAYLEMFDIAMGTEPNLDGIQKYMLDYVSSAAMETGYLRAHNRERAHREAVRGAFEGKTAVGVRVYEAREKFAAMELDADEPDNEKMQNLLFSKAAAFCVQNSLPTIYEGTDTVGIAFGENAKYLPAEALDNGLILDATAALILARAGVDVGIDMDAPDYRDLPLSRLKEWKQMCHPLEEHFSVENEDTRVEPQAVIPLPLRAACRVESTFLPEDGECVPTSYTYENSRGQRFLVLLSDSYDLLPYNYRSYMRQAQLVRFAAWVKHPLPAMVTGHPDLYIRCSREGNRLSVLLLNLSIDVVEAPLVELDGKACALRPVVGDASVEGDGTTVRLSDIAAFTAAAFEVTLAE